MKLKYITASLLAAGLFTTTSCVNDLEVFPLDPNVTTAEDAYATAEGYTQALNKIYSVWALSGQNAPDETDIIGLDAGNTVLLRCWFTLQTNPTDESKCSWPNAWNSVMNQMTWSTTQVEPIEGAYQRAMFIVALVNEFMRNIGNAPAEIDKELYTAEARYCRALAYYTLMDLFGRPPFITEQNYSLAPAQLETRADLFDWIESELLDIYDALPETPEYGHAGKYAVDALLSRMYLNAEVYTGTERYTDCITRCNNILNSGRYDLADNYAELFMADNTTNANANKEFIFPIQADGVTMQSYGVGIFILATRSGSQGAESGISGGWAGFRSTGNLVRTFEFPSDDESTWTPDNIMDKRGIFYNNNGAVALDITTNSIETFDNEGWAVYKFTNIGSDGNPGKNSTFPDMDFPLFRLGEIYLNYAEAVARGGQGGNMSQAVNYINALRDRGYGDTNHRISENWLTASATIGGTNTSVAYGNLLNERQREMYFECTRRTDLIRYGLYTGNSYIWVDKGGVITGVGTDSHFDLYPIPTTDISVNANLEQNPGY